MIYFNRELNVWVNDENKDFYISRSSETEEELSKVFNTLDEFEEWELTTLRVCHVCKRKFSLEEMFVADDDDQSFICQECLMMDIEF